jgi:hypothetical protein
MFGPHDRENAELDEVGLAVQRLQDALIFFWSEPMFGDDLERNFGNFQEVHGALLAASSNEA